MISKFFGKKLQQTQVFDDQGNRVGATVVDISPAVVTQVKNSQKEGYSGIQLGLEIKSVGKINQPEKGHLKSLQQGNFLPRILREVRLDSEAANEAAYKVGDKIDPSQFIQAGDIVKVTGISKAKGFQGGVRRHGFKGGSRTHGQSDRERAPGSIGQTTTPGRVYRGKRMAGRMGGGTVTVSGLRVMSVDAEKHILVLKGSFPGNKNSWITITK